MSIQSLIGTQPLPTRRRCSGEEPTRTAGASFEERMAQTSNAVTGSAAHPRMPSENAVCSGTRDGLADGLDEARLLLLRRTREGHAWKEDQEAWDRLMKGLDSWIDALRERSEQERKEGRSGGVTAEGGEALAALYRGYIAAAVRQENAGAAPEVSREDLLAALTDAQGALLERLKEDKAAEEEREEWADLLRRLDDWIEKLRGEPEEPERVPRTDCAAGDAEVVYK